ncbi:MAG: cell division protein ZapA [Erythrobacter sp.]|nr:cell division protein ZapA [Erythrobacter sp.]NNC53861.1 cell division protein ZapA [Erythrobacter sp.]
MSDVKLQVGGRVYTVSTANGQEDKVRGLAQMVDEKISGMGKNATSNEAKNLLFAAILLADELTDARNAAQSHPPDPGIDTDALAIRLERVANALEGAASALEGETGAS